MGSQGSHIQSHHHHHHKERRDSTTSPPHSPRSSTGATPRGSTGSSVSNGSAISNGSTGSGISPSAASPPQSPRSSPPSSQPSTLTPASSTSSQTTSSPLSSPTSTSSNVVEIIPGLSREVEVFELAVAGNSDRLAKLIKEAKKEGQLKSVVEYRHPPAEHRTPLHAASRFGKPNCVSLLLKYGADLWAVSSTGSTPLHDAAWMGHLDCARLLVSHSFSTPELRQRDYVNTPGEGHKSPLRLAAYNGHVEVGMFLIANGAKMTMKDDRKSTPLAAAAFSRSARTPGHPAFVRMLCKMAKESDIDMNDFLNNRDDEDSTPVHIASLRNHTEVLKILVEYGADINVVARSLPGSGNTPLHLACREDSVDVALVLLEKGADPNIKNDFGQTPLDLAILPMSYWNPTLIKSLLERGGRLGVIEHQQRLLPIPSPLNPIEQDKFQQALESGISKKQWKEAFELFEDLLKSSTKTELSFVLHWNAGQCAIRIVKQEGLGDGRWLKRAEGHFEGCFLLLTTKLGSDKVSKKTIQLLEVLEKRLQIQFLKGKEESEETLKLKEDIQELASKYHLYLKGVNDILLETFPMPASMHSQKDKEKEDEETPEVDVYAFERLFQTRDQPKNDDLSLVYKYVFKAVNRRGEIVGQVNLEQSKIAWPNYLLGMNDTNGQHSTLRRLVSGDATYQEVRQAISEALQGRVQAATSSHRGKQ